MKNFNLTEEITRLKNNFIAQMTAYDLPLRIKPDDMSFSYWNWIITLPFNYYYLVPNTHKSLIRKLAVINAMYGYFFMTQDDVFDEYHLPAIRYKMILTKYCAVQDLRNLAIAQMITISGSRIFNYIYKYESKYYQSLLNEKINYSGSEKSMSIENSLNLIGEKASPAIIPFSAFCILMKCEHFIQLGETMIKKYHIAHQIFDDWQDIEQDVTRPEKSWLLHHICTEIGSELNHPGEIRNFIKDTKYNLDIFELICSNLAAAKDVAKSLKFVHFEENIRHLERLTAKCFQRNEI
jgi:hypothetical protein